MVRRISSAPATPADYALAEGPVWDGRGERLLWVDIPAGAVIVGELEAARIRERERITLGGTVGAVALAEDGGLLVAVDDGLATIAADGAIRRSGGMLSLEGRRRMNDGQCDPAGRFVVGSLALAAPAGREVLLQVDPEGAMATMRTGLGLSNGIAWSPDGRTIYHVDTLAGTLCAADYRPQTGEWGEFVPIVAIEDGAPDGLAVDSAGGLWLAVWGAGEVRRFDPEGRLTAVVAVDAPLTSSVAFAGADLDRLVITTARDDLPPEQRRRFPASGALFLAAPGIAGLPARRWRGDTAAPRRR